MMPTKSDLNIVFIHGLESKPNGSKVRGIRKFGHKVHCEDMLMSLFRLDRQNSIIRNVLRQRTIHLWALCMCLVPLIGWFVDWFWVAWIVDVVLLMLLLFQKERIFARACKTSFEACLEMQISAIAHQKPDLIIGSSWGGAITLELIRRGLWTGPAIVLAPAFTKIHLIINTPQLNAHLDQLRQLSKTQPIVIYHDPTDGTVPYAHSKTLCLNANFTFHTVDAGGHRLLGLLENGALAAEINRVCGLV